MHLEIRLGEFMLTLMRVLMSGNAFTIFLYYCIVVVIDF